LPITVKKNYDKVDILFRKEDIDSTESFFIEKGLIKSEKKSIFNLLISKLNKSK